MDSSATKTFVRFEDEKVTLLVLFVALCVGRQLLQTIVDRCCIRKRPQANAILRSAYELARPMLPDPNELKDLSKSTGKTIEDLNSWFRAARAQDRSAVVASRTGEAIWRFLLLSTSVVLVFLPGLNGALTFAQGRAIRSCIHLQLLAMHAISFPSMAINEFLNVFIEHSARATLIALVDIRLSELVSITHDSVDAALEFSRILDLLGFVNLAKLAFLAFIGAWTMLRFYVFPSGLYTLGFLGSPSKITHATLPVYCALFVQASFDIREYWTCLTVAKNAFWSAAVPSRRANRGDSLSSATSLDYESDSSLSSNLRGEYFKDE
jgi:hypothetical protein